MFGFCCLPLKSFDLCFGRHLSTCGLGRSFPGLLLNFVRVGVVQHYFRANLTLSQSLAFLESLGCPEYSVRQLYSAGWNLNVLQSCRNSRNYSHQSSQELFLSSLGFSIRGKGISVQIPRALFLHNSLSALCHGNPCCLSLLPSVHLLGPSRLRCCAIAGLTVVVSHFAGLTVLLCLLSHFLKVLFHIFCPAFQLFMVGGPVLYQLFFHGQQQKSPKIFSGWLLKILTLRSLVCSLLLGIWLWQVALDKSHNKIFNHKRDDLEHKPPGRLYQDLL